MSCLFKFKSQQEKEDIEQRNPDIPENNPRHSKNGLQAPSAISERVNPEENIMEGNKSTPFDEREIFRLKSSWRTVHRQIEETGAEYFLKYA